MDVRGNPAAALSAYAAAVTADAPLSWWRLGETSGTTAAALGSAAANGSYASGCTLGAPGLIAHDTDTAVALAGSNGYVAIGSPAALNLSRNFTIEAWINAASLPTTGNLITVLSYSNGGFFMGLDSAGKVIILRSATAFIGSSGASLAAGVTHMLELTVDASGNWGIYIDGASDATGSTTDTFYGSTDLYIGADRPTAGYPAAFPGVIDEVAIYGSALSSTRIAAHYAAGI